MTTVFIGLTSTVIEFDTRIMQLGLNQRNASMGKDV